MNRVSKNKTNNQKIVNAKVTKIKPDHIEVELNDQTKGFCYLDEISDFNVYPLSSLFKENFFYKFLVKNFDANRKVYFLNYRNLHPEEIKWKTTPIPTARHYHRLKNHLKEQITAYFKKEE